MPRRTPRSTAHPTSASAAPRPRRTTPSPAPGQDASCAATVLARLDEAMHSRSRARASSALLDAELFALFVPHITETLEAMSTAHPHSPYPRALLGAILANQGDHAAAIAAMEAADVPGHAVLRQAFGERLAACYEHQEAWTKALPLRAALADRSRVSEAWLAYGDCCLHTGDLAMAAQQAVRAIEDSPDYAHAYRLLAEVRLQTGELAPALLAARMAHTLLPTAPAIGRVLITALLQSGHYAEALAEIDRWRVVAADHPNLAVFTGWAYIGVARHADALPWLRTAVQDRPEHLWAWYLLGTAALQTQDWEEAERAITRLLSEKTGQAYGYELQAERAYLRQDAPGCLAACQQALAQEPDNTLALCLLATISFALQDHDTGHQTLAHLQRLDADLAAAVATTGVCPTSHLQLWWGRHTPTVD